MGFAILEAIGKTLTPTLVPVNKDGSFTALGSTMGLNTEYAEALPYR
jgi:hypothetical protein